MKIASLHAARVVGDAGEAFVFGHGLGGTQEHWGPLATHLVARGRVVTFDLAGSGACDRSVFSPVRHATLMGFADDLALLCADLELRAVTYIGHSLSGMSGILASVADPGLISRMVLIGSSARYTDDPSTGYVGGLSEEALAAMLVDIKADFALWSAGFGPSIMSNEDRPELATEFTHTLLRYEPDVALAIIRAAYMSDFRAVVPRVRVPALVLQGTDDPAVPLAAAQWLADTIPDARMKVLKTRGHLPHVVDPDEVIAAIDVFLAETDG